MEVDLALLQRENARLRAEKQSLESINAMQAHQIEMLKRLLYGAKRERFVPKPEDKQLPLPFEAGQVSEGDAPKKRVSYERRKPKNQGHPGRNAFPEHLERVTTRIEPDYDTTGMAYIGDEVTEELEYTPARLLVHCIVRPKYSKGKEKGVVVAPMPERPIPKCIASISLLAYIITAKFTDHLPIYRIVEIFKREGVKISTGTINGWQESLYLLLLPLYNAMKAQILAEGYLQADETTIKAIQKGKGKAVTGYQWAYHSPIRNGVVFDYRPSRSREGPGDILKTFKGYLQTDGYKGYEAALAGNKDVVRVGCMAHIRRYFEQALENDMSRAEHALGEIQKLYAIERMARENGMSHKQRHALRLEEALPILNGLGKWMAAEYQQTLPKSPIGKALAYGINRWEAMLKYLMDGALEIDNNWVENKIRPIALGRKNFLFAGSHHGGDRAALFYSFMTTCKANGVNPYKWLKYTLERISDYKVCKIHELLPYNIDPVILE